MGYSLFFSKLFFLFSFFWNNGLFTLEKFYEMEDWRKETPWTQNHNQRPTPAKGTTSIYSLRGVLAPLQLYTKPSLQPANHYLDLSEHFVWTSYIIVQNKNLIYSIPNPAGCLDHVVKENKKHSFCTQSTPFKVDSQPVILTGMSTEISLTNSTSTFYMIPVLVAQKLDTKEPQIFVDHFK